MPLTIERALTGSSSDGFGFADALPGCSPAEFTQAHQGESRDCACSTISRKKAAFFKAWDARASGCGAATGLLGGLATRDPKGE